MVTGKAGLGEFVHNLFRVPTATRIGMISSSFANNIIGPKPIINPTGVEVVPNIGGPSARVMPDGNIVARDVHRNGFIAVFTPPKYTTTPPPNVAGTVKEVAKGVATGAAVSAITGA